MRVGIIGIVVVGLVFLGSSFCLANGGAPVTKEVTKETVGEATSAKQGVGTTGATGGAIKSPGTATFLSVLCPGLGQIYNDDSLIKVLIMGGIEGLCWGLVGGTDMEALGIFGLAMGRVVSSVDAYYTAVEKNRGLSLQIDNEKVVVAIKGEF
ncbi:MAG: hypothetical protein ISS46_00015 [Candidatus Omnitrophica bacterium]|nr:hypothetical protein [Candidatus Omnitrophota bacterium]